jgi:hypothetical protein
MAEGRTSDPGRQRLDAKLEALARIRPADITSAAEAAQRHGSARFNALLNATPRDQSSAGESCLRAGLLVELPRYFT